MPSLQSRVFYFAMQVVMKRVISRSNGSGQPVEAYRRFAAQSFAEPLPRNISSEPATLNGSVGEWIAAGEVATDRVLLFLHGGGYILKSPAMHRVLVGRLAEIAGCRAFMLDYRLAPEHPFPAALEDASAAYEGLLAQGIAPTKIVVAGDSAGGGLAVALLLHLRDRGLPLPAAAALLSPWLDCSVAGESIAAMQRQDPVLQARDLRQWGAFYTGSNDVRNPLISPLFASVQGLPPLLIHVGEHEILREEAVQFAANVRAAGGNAALKLWPGQLHDFQVFAGLVPEGKKSIAELGAFLQQHFA